LNLEKLWDEVNWKIEAEGGLALGDLKLIRPQERVAGQDILVGLDSESARHLLITADEEDEGRVDDSSRGICIEVRRFFKSDGTTEHFCDIACKLPELNPLFTVVAQDMVEALRERSERSVFDTCVEAPCVFA
jgi:hypothetical protein